MNLPDPEPVLDIIEAFRRSKTMFAALSMGVFDRLHDSPATADAVARHLNAKTDATGRLLDACAALGLLHKRDGVYSNTPVAAAYLVTTSPHSLYGYILYSDEALYPMWGNLAGAVREGTPRWMQTFGLDGPIFSSFFRTEQAMRDFARGMHGVGMLTSPKVSAAFGLGRFHRLATASKLWPAISSKTNFPRRISMRWDGFCTSGVTTKSICCCARFCR